VEKERGSHPVGVVCGGTGADYTVQVDAMRVLVACEFSGVVRDAFLRKGHDAWSCDLLPTETPGPHIQGDVLEILDDGWDMMIAHPPCTYLTYAGTRQWNEPGRLRKRLESLGFFANLWEAPIEKICIENPMGCATPTIAKYTQIVHPYYFGEPESKRTCLWLKNLPPLKHEKEDTLFSSKTHTKPKVYGYFKNGPNKGRPIYGTFYMKFSEDRGHERSRFWPGIAEAMADQWGSL
jgi:hypothetical protein